MTLLLPEQYLQLYNIGEKELKNVNLKLVQLWLWSNTYSNNIFDFLIELWEKWKKFISIFFILPLQFSEFNFFVYLSSALQNPPYYYFANSKLLQLRSLIGHVIYQKNIYDFLAHVAQKESKKRTRASQNYREDL